MTEKDENARKKDRFDLNGCDRTMKAVVTAGNGGYEKLEYRRVPIPAPGPGEVLLRVLAAGVNNTDINTRVGWYSSSVTTGTETAALGGENGAAGKKDGGWNRPTPFPFIQGADCCGRVAAVASGEDESMVGARVLVRSCMVRGGTGPLETAWLGIDFDGAFAQYVKVPAEEVFPVDCTWSDAQLGAVPCAYGTAENMLHRARVGEGEHVLVTGASGGVGSAAVQLAVRRGATVTAVAGKAKMEAVGKIGAKRVIPRGDDVAAILGESTVDAVVDVVAGPAVDALLRVLKRGGRYVCAGAIDAPFVTIDIRTLYLKDLVMIGSTAWDAPVFPNLIAYIERGEIAPLLAKTFPLERIGDAQRAFLEKAYLGKIVLIPPPD